MPAERSPMRKVREVLRLRHALGVSERQIAQSRSGSSRSTVGEYLRRAAVIGITWPVPDETRRCRAGAAAVHAAGVRREAGAAAAGLGPRPRGAEAARRDAGAAVGGVPRPSTPTATATAGSAISTATGASASRPTMRQTHVAGEKLFVDFAGDTVPVFDADDRRGAARPHLRRGAGRVQLHLRRGALERGACRLDRRARQRA